MRSLRWWVSGVAMGLLCISSGCFPAAYVYPDIDYFSVDLSDVGDVADSAATESAPTVIVFQEGTGHFSTPVPRLAEAERIHLVEHRSERFRYLSSGLAGFVGLASVLSWGDSWGYGSQLKAYRRGCRPLIIEPWQPLDCADWQLAETIEELETAIDSLSEFGPTPETPLPALDLTNDDAVSGLLHSKKRKVDANTSRFLAGEYEWLARVVEEKLAAEGRQTVQTVDLDVTRQRLLLKSQYWRAHDPNSIIVLQ